MRSGKRLGARAGRVRRGWWRLRAAQEPAGAQALKPGATAPAAAPAPVPEAWAEMCEQFAWRLLVLTEQLRPELDEMESREEDPDRLARLDHVAHGVTPMRPAALDLLVLVRRGGDE